MTAKEMIEREARIQQAAAIIVDLICNGKEKKIAMLLDLPTDMVMEVVKRKLHGKKKRRVTVMVYRIR